MSSSRSFGPAWAATFCLLLAGCTAGAGSPMPTVSRPHHVADGFRNPDGAGAPRSLSDLLRWRWHAWREGLPPAPRQPTPEVSPDLATLRANTGPGHPSATWIGHATVLLQAGGLNVLTDPVFSQRASPVGFAGPRRAQPPGIALPDLPPIDVVLVSHNHYDHLDRDSIVQLAARGQGRTVFLVPLGLKAWMEAQGVRDVFELDWWETHRVRGVPFQLVQARHWSGRGPGDRNRTLWGGWAVLASDQHCYFSGDTGYAAHFREARERDGAFDLALLAVGAYEPRWFMGEQHMNPSEAVQAHLDLGARQSMGIHWGTFAMTDEPLDQPPRDLGQARAAIGLPEAAFGVLAIGQTRWLRPRDARQSGP
jgi:N-acyl-phosphatidylethanolamine-hydrolysing phospholipase D